MKRTGEFFSSLEAKTSGALATRLSVAFWADGEPYWLLIGSFAGLVELVPII